ncbi:ABC transporter ATP-binding protein [uncultured Adlercreutzia sp.]|uniref:ABC transporter ATP-binding protein n=1 Tax=uncultured Adlercreutzia sp. TaxID=875803 RepID=UPI0025E92079|nr:ABC transporter ATP-binding protein [uncultured Adlercreutzia sp.]
MTESMLEYRGVDFSYQPGAPFMEGLSAVVPQGVVTSIIGPNGCGKSTLVKLASGLLRPTAGEVRLAGCSTAGLSARERARAMAVLSQMTRPAPMTVQALVECGRHPHRGFGGRSTAEDRRLVEEALALAGVAHFRDHDVRRLSGGERQRAYLAMTLAQDTPLIVLDEPTTYLDINACHDLMTLVRALNRKQGKTVAIVIHDIDLALRYSDWLVVMERGRVAACGPVASVLDGGAIQRVFSLDVYPFDRPDVPSGAPDVSPDTPAERAYVVFPHTEPSNSKPFCQRAAN